jgi:hypothetical protein
VVNENEPQHGYIKHDEALYCPLGKPFRAWIVAVDIEGGTIPRDQPEHIGHEKQDHIFLLAVPLHTVQGDHQQKVDDVEGKKINTDKKEPE